MANAYYACFLKVFIRNAKTKSWMGHGRYVYDRGNVYNTVSYIIIYLLMYNRIQYPLCDCMVRKTNTPKLIRPIRTYLHRLFNQSDDTH